MKTRHSGPAFFHHPFTLIELLATIMIITVLLGLVIGGAQLAGRKSEEAKIKARMERLELALEEYKDDWGYYPVYNGQLNFDLQSPSGTYYLEDYTDEENAYGQSGTGTEPFRYTYPGTHNPASYDLRALGADVQAGTDDDITNWARN